MNTFIMIKESMILTCLNAHMVFTDHVNIGETGDINYS